MEKRKKKLFTRAAVIVASAFTFAFAGIAAMVVGSNSTDYQETYAATEKVTLDFKKGNDITVGVVHGGGGNWNEDHGKYVFTDSYTLDLSTTVDNKAIVSAKITVSEYDWCAPSAYVISPSNTTKTVSVGGNYNTFITVTNINSKYFKLGAGSSFFVSTVEVEIGNAYSLTFNLNGGAIKGDYSSYYVEGSGTTLPSHVVKDGYIFDGWYENSKFTGSEVTSIGTKVTGAKTYYAKWITASELATKKGITVKDTTCYYDKKGHGISITGSLTGYTITYSTNDTNYNLTENPLYTEVSTKKVYFKLSKEGQRDIYGSANVNILDVYYMVGEFSNNERLDDYLLTLNPKPYEDVEEWYINGVELTAGNSFRIQGASGKWFPADSKKAYEVAKTGTYNIRFRPNADGRSSAWFNKYLNVEYVAPTHSVTFNTNGGTINSGEISQYVEEVYTILPTDVTKEDYVFAGWFDNEELKGNAISTIFDTDMGSKTYWAKWVENVAQVGENQYNSLAKAFNAATEGETIKLLCDINLIGEDFNYVEVNKDLTIDLNGHILNLTSDVEGRYKIWVVDGKQLTIDNSIPVTGGVIGEFGVKSQYGSSVSFVNGRLDLSLEALASNKGYKTPANTLFSTIEETDENAKYGFLTFVRPLTNEETVEKVEQTIDAIGTVTYHDECKERIDFARAEYNALNDDLKANVTNYNVLEKAEADYPVCVADKAAADVVKGKVNIIGIVVYTETCHNKILAARDAYEALSDAQKALVTNYETLTSAETRYEKLENAYTKAQDVITSINEIGDVTFGGENDSLKDIQAAREAYDKLSEDEKSFVSNYATLSAAEATYEYLQVNKAVGIGENYFDTLKDAYEASKNGDTIKLYTDIDLSGKDTAYLMLRRDVTIDLNGHAIILPSGDNIKRVFWVSDAAVVTIENNRPANGGIKGDFGAYVASGAKLILKDCRLSLSLEQATGSNSTYTIAEEYIVKNINGGSADANGYVAIVRLINDQDAADVVSEMIDALPEAEAITEADRVAVKEAVEAYEDLTDVQKAKVEGEKYEKLYAALSVIKDVIDKDAVNHVTELVNALPTVDEVAISDKTAVINAREAYDLLNDDQKQAIAPSVVEKLVALEERVAFLEEQVETAKTCKHVVAVTTLTSLRKTTSYGYITPNENYTNNSIASGAKGISINIKGSGSTCAGGEAVITVDLYAPEDMIFKVHWYIHAQSGYAGFYVNFKLNTAAEQRLVNGNDIDPTWFVYEANCHAGHNTLVIKFTSQSRSWRDDSANGWDFRVLPENVSAFDGDHVCAHCGTECLHNNIKMVYDSRLEDYCFTCNHLCKHKLLLEEILNGDAVTVAAARKAYDALNATEKAKVSTETLATLEAAEVAVAERTARENTNKAGAVSDAIALLPDVDLITLDYREEVLDIRAAYNALTNTQKGLVSQESLQKLSGLETKMTELWNADCANRVTTLINNLPALDDMTLDAKDDVEAARAAYDALTEIQKALVEGTTLTKLTDAENRIDELISLQEIQNVRDLINVLPAAESVTLDVKDGVEAARAAYEALTSEQQKQVEEAIYNKLVAVENKYSELKLAYDTSVANVVNNAITALPAADDVVFADQGIIEQTRTAYNALTNEQKALVSEELKNKLTAVEAKLNFVRWKDVVLEDGTYVFVSTKDNTKLIVHVNQNSVKVGNYNSTTINDNRTDNRSGKWIIARIGDSNNYSLVNIYDKENSDKNRLLDVGGWSTSLFDGINLDFVDITSTLSESETNIFRFTKRLGVDMEDDEYFIRLGSEGNNSFNYVLNFNSDNVINVRNYALRNAGQMWKVIKVNGDEEFIQAVISKIKVLHDYDGTTLEDETAVKDARTSYNSLVSNYQKNSVINYQKLTAAEQKIVDLKAAKAVDDKITAIGTVADTTASKNLIDTARTAYNALTDAQKLLVTKFDTLKEAEKTCAGYVTSAIEALPDPEDLVISTDGSKVSAARSKLDALTTEEKEYIKGETIDKLVADECAVAIKSLPPIATGIPGSGQLSLANKTSVEAARAAYNALTDAQKLVLGDVVYEILTDAETEISDLQAAQNVIDAINALPDKDTITSADQAKVNEALTAYNSLTDYQEGKIPAATYNKIAASKVAADILALPVLDNLTLNHSDTVASLRTAYDDLGSDRQALIAQSVVDKLKASEKRIADMKAAKAVDDLIDAIGVVEYNTTSHEKIIAARTGYNNLTSDQVVFVTKLAVLTDAETAYAHAAEEAINNDLNGIVIKEITGTTEEKENIQKAKDKYDELTPEEKEKFNQDTVDKLFTAVVTIDVIELPDIENIDNTISEEDADAIRNAKESYDNLTPTQKNMLADGVVNKLFASEATLDIVELPVGEDIKTTDKKAIEDAKAVFNNLTPTQKELVPQDVKDTLIAAETVLDIIELPVGTNINKTNKKAIEDAEKAYSDLTPTQKAKVPQSTVDTLKAAGSVLDIVELPTGEDIKTTDKEAIEAARAVFNSLTPTQKDKVPQTTVDTLVAAETVLDIVELPVGKDITATDKTAIEDARTAYEALTPEQKAKVAQATVDTLVAAETTLVIVELPVSENITADDADSIAAARSAYNKLTDAQKAKVDQTTVDTLVAAETTLQIVKLPAIDIDEIGEHEQDVKAAQTAYDKLSDAQKEKVAQSAKDKLFVSTTVCVALHIPDSTSFASETITSEQANTIKDAKAKYDALTDHQKEMVPQAIVDEILYSSASLNIIELPKGTNIKTTDKAAIEAAREQYKALSDAQKAKVPQSTVDTLVAAETVLDIVELPVGKDITAADGADIEDARKAYDKLSDDQKAKVPQATVDTLVAAETTLEIVKLPAGDDIVVTSKEAIEAARSAYNKLTDDQKAKVDQTTVDTLVAAETTLDIVELPSVDKISIEDKTDITNAKTAYDKLSNDQKAKVPQSAKDKLFASVTTVAIIEIPAADAINNEISDDNANAIKAARASYDALSEDQKALIPEETQNKVLASSTALTIIELPVGENIKTTDKDAIKAARDAYNGLSQDQQGLIPQDTKNILAGAETTLTIVELPVGENIKTTDKDAIKAARTAYEDLTPEQKAKVAQATVDTLVAAETTLTIVELPAKTDITADSRSAIVAAREAYKTLTPEQKAKVAQATVDTLVATETTLTIVELPVGENITADNAEAIAAARAAYNALTADQKAKVDQTTVDTLVAAEAILDIVKLPASGNITADNADSIAAARSAYDKLTADQKAKVPTSTVDTLVAAESTLKIVKLPVKTAITANDKADIEAALASYNALSNDQKALVSDDVKDSLFASVATLRIAEMPDIANISANSETAIKAARTAYDSLTPEQKALVPAAKLNTLVASEATLGIVKLPVGEEIKATDKEAIQAARTAYEALSAEQKALVQPTTVDTLVVAEAVLKIAELPVGNDITGSESDLNKFMAANLAYKSLNDTRKEMVPQSVVDTLLAAQKTLQIVLLPAKENITPNSRNAIVAARQAYNDLSNDQKAKVTKETVDTLVAAETTLQIVELPVGTDIKTTDKAAIIAAREAYDVLSTERKAKVAQATVDTLVAAETTLTIVELPVASDITADSRKAIEDARTAYEALTADQKAKVAQATVDTLVAAETTLTIVELPSTVDIVTDDEDDIVAAREAFDAISSDQQALVPQAIKDKLIASESVLAIIKLPVGENIKATDKVAIEAARKSFNDLSDDQEALVPQSTVDTLVASEAVLQIVQLPVGNDIMSTDADAINAARDAYNALCDDQKYLVPQSTVDTLVAAETTLQIVKLPVGEAITANDSEAIVDARRAYSQLEDAQKEKVTQETLDTLRAAEITLYIVKLPVGNDISEDDAMRIAGVRKAYNYATDAEKAKIAQATVDTLVAAETTLQIVELPEITLISVDDKEAIQAARTAYEALTADQKAKVTQETLDTLVASEMTLQIVELPAVSDVTSTNGDVIRAARTAYDLLSDAQLELVPYASRDKLIASESALAIAELPVGNDIKATDKTAIEAAREQYEALSDKQKGLVAQDAVDTLVAAETTLQIVELPAGEAIVKTSRTAIEAARTAYDALTAAQLEKTTQDTLDTLIAAEVTLQIVELPATKDITPESRTAIVAARIAYEGLTSEQQAKVVQETLDTLIAAETALTIVELPDVTNISADSQEDIEAAREAYEELSEEQKKLVPQETLDTLVAAETTLQIVELPATDDITSDSANDIAAAREAYDALTPEQKEKVSKATVDALTSSEATLSIVKLPVVGELTFDNKEDVIAVRNEYDALSDEGKANVPADVVEKLVAAEVEIADIEAAKDTSEMIDSLPDVTNITREDREDVTSTRTSYDELSEYQQGKVSDETLAKLEEIEEVYTSMDKIDSIGTVAYTKDSKALIDDAKAYYDSLNEQQKVAIDNTNALNKAVTDYYAVDTAVNKADSITNIRHDARSDEAIKEARKEYESLSQDQKDLLPEESLQKIEDSETVYEALNKIYAIGNAEYTDESETLIAEARKAYDELSEQQKAMVNKIDFAVLETAETSYANQENTANVTHITLIIIVSVLLGGGAILLALMVLSIFKAKKGLKALSVAFVPAILATSHYLDSRFIVLYVLAAVLLIVLVAIIVLWIKNPSVFKDMKNLFQKGEKMEMSPAPAVQAAPAAQPIPQPLLQEPVSDNEEEETVTVTDEKGNIFQIRFVKSFTAKLIQANEESKKYYEELKNYVLSYKKVTSRVSWNYDSINSGRNPVLKFAIRGKTLGVYFPLNADDYTDSKYKVEKVESKKFEDVPCLYRIKNDRRCEYAKELIDVVMNNLGLEKGEEQKESYYLHYEENKPLIARGLIKELKVQVNKPARETQILSVVTDEDGEEVVTKRDSKGNIFQIRYIKSFTAKLSQADDELKDYYNELKNYALSYKKANSRISWHFDSVNVGRNQVLKFVIRGKTLCLYYALNADDYAESKYKVEKVESKKYEDVPCLYRIKNDRRRDYAKDLIDVVMANVPTEKGKESNEDFRVPYETTEALLEKGLIKELKVQVNNPASRETQILSVVTNDEGDEVVTKQDRNGNIFEIRYIKSFTAKLSQAEQELKDYYNELKNYALGYKKANSRVSWHFDSINVGRNQVLKFAIRGKTLCLYFALNADDYADSKYKVEKVESKKFEDVPCLYRIKNDRRRDYAKDLIDTVMGNAPTEKGKESNEEFRVPFEETKVLLEKGLIKEVKTKVGTKEEVIQSITVEEADKQMSDEKAEASIEIDTVHKKRIGKKEIINIDTLSNSFNNGDEVTIEALIAKKLIPSKTGSVKLLARGTLNKKLTVCLNDYSLQAVKMIALLGGQVKIIK